MHSIQSVHSIHSMHSTAFKTVCCLCTMAFALLCRLQQGVVIQKQQAKEKLHKLVAPLLSMHSADQLSLSALGAIQPKLNLSFSEVGATLRDGSIILQGVTGHFNRGQVQSAVSVLSVDVVSHCVGGWVGTRPL